MVAVVRESERKYEALPGGSLPDLTAVPGVATVRDDGTVLLDATYHDTADGRLAADGLTLRHRRGGTDAGWHLKLPVAPGVREELREPPGEELPESLAALVRSRVRGVPLVPVVRLRAERAVHTLLDADGVPLAEVSVDRVDAERLPGGARAGWTEIEAELAEGRPPEVLDALDGHLTAAGLRPAADASKLARALAETAPETVPETAAAGPPETAGAVVLAYVRDQVRALIALDPAVRRDLPDSVHRMRVATRRLRSCFRTHRGVLDRAVTDPLGEELRWLAAELGVDRDREVLTARLRERVDTLPPELRRGPLAGRLRAYDRARRSGSRRRLLAVLDGERHLRLLDALVELVADPPLRPAAHRPAERVLRKAVARDFDRLAARVGRALAEAERAETARAERAVSGVAGLRAAADGSGRPADIVVRDEAMHTARKAAKRTRYAAESARPVFRRRAKEYARRMAEVQELLGLHQDTVVTRAALLELAAEAEAAGEPSFSYGLLHEREAALGEECARRLPALWREVSRHRRLG